MYTDKVDGASPDSKCTRCTGPISVSTRRWGGSKIAAAAAKQRSPWKSFEAKDIEAEQREKFAKLARIYKQGFLDPSMEPELRDLETRFNKKTKASETEQVDTSSTAENKLVARHQQNNSRVRAAELWTTSEKAQRKAIEKQMEAP